MAKGPWSLGPCAPYIHSAALHVHATASKERQSLEGIADQGQNRTKESRTKGQRPRGVFGVWVPSWHTHIQQKQAAKRYRQRKTTAVANYYGVGRRSIFCTEGSFGLGLKNIRPVAKIFDFIETPQL